MFGAVTSTPPTASIAKSPAAGQPGAKRGPRTEAKVKTGGLQPNAVTHKVQSKSVHGATSGLKSGAAPARVVHPVVSQKQRAATIAALKQKNAEPAVAPLATRSSVKASDARRSEGRASHDRPTFDRPICRQGGAANGTTGPSTTEVLAALPAGKRVRLAYKLLKESVKRWRRPDAVFVSGTARLVVSSRRNESSYTPQRRQRDAREERFKCETAKTAHYDPNAVIDTKEAATAAREGFNLGDTVASTNLTSTIGSLRNTHSGAPSPDRKLERSSSWAKSNVPRGTLMFPWRSLPATVQPKEREVTPGPGAYTKPLLFIGSE